MSAAVANETDTEAAPSHTETVLSNNITTLHVCQRLHSVIKNLFTLRRLIYLGFFWFLAQFMLDLLAMHELPEQTLAHLNSIVYRKVTFLVVLFLVKSILVDSGFTYGSFSTVTTRLMSIIYCAVVIHSISHRYARTNLPIRNNEREDLSKDQLDLIWFVMAGIPLAGGMLATDIGISILYWIFPPSGDSM